MNPEVQCVHSGHSLSAWPWFREPQRSCITICTDSSTQNISPGEDWETAGCLIWFKDQEEKEPRVHGEVLLSEGKLA